MRLFLNVVVNANFRHPAKEDANTVVQSKTLFYLIRPAKIAFSVRKHDRCEKKINGDNDCLYLLA